MRVPLPPKKIRQRLRRDAAICSGISIHCETITHRGDRIRTCDILVPNQALYQAELRPGESEEVIGLLVGKQELFQVMLRDRQGSILNIARFFS